MSTIQNLKTFGKPCAILNPSFTFSAHPTPRHPIATLDKNSQLSRARKREASNIIAVFVDTQKHVCAIDAVLAFVFAQG
jgi:hypothetical protein